jgi:hypothetical protein
MADLLISSITMDDLFFQSLVDSYVTKNERFLRRDWLAADVDACLADPACRFVLLSADPGAGKITWRSHDRNNS